MPRAISFLMHWELDLEEIHTYRVRLFRSSAYIFLLTSAGEGAYETIIGTQSAGVQVCILLHGTQNMFTNRGTIGVSEALYQQVSTSTTPVVHFH